MVLEAAGAPLPAPVSTSFPVLLSHVPSCPGSRVKVSAPLKRPVSEVNMHTLLYLKRITNKVYCTAQGTLLSVIQNGWERSLGRVDAWICIAGVPLAAHLKLLRCC